MMSNPLMFPPVDNYKAFRARKMIFADRHVHSARTRNPNFEIHLAKDQSTKYFRGSNPSKNPFRVSTKLVIEQKMKKMQPKEPVKPRRVKNARKIPSLFERSIVKKKKESLWPPDDYYGWNVQSEEDGNLYC